MGIEPTAAEGQGSATELHPRIIFAGKYSINQNSNHVKNNRRRIHHFIKKPEIIISYYLLMHCRAAPSLSSSGSFFKASKVEQLV